MAAPPASTAAASGLAYLAPCTLPLSAGLSVIISNSAIAACPNPFQIDFHHNISRIRAGAHPLARTVPVDPRLNAYVMLAVYRLLRALIPSHDAVVRAVDTNVQQPKKRRRPTKGQHAAEVTTPPPPTFPPPAEVVADAMDGRLAELFTGELLGVAQSTRAKFDNETAHLFTLSAADIQTLLQLDAAADETALSSWQLWLIAGPVWQKQAAAIMELILAELWEELSRRLLPGLDDAWPRGERGQPSQEVWSIATLYSQVIGDDGDAELTALWRIIGMPTDCPAGVDMPYLQAYKEQFRRRMEAAALASAPWMADKRQVAERMLEWRKGRLLDGDATFFQRFHIRPVQHLGVKLPRVFGQSEAYPGARKSALDDEYEGEPYDPRPWLTAAFDLVDAAGVRWPFLIRCVDEPTMRFFPQRTVVLNAHVTIREDGRPVPFPAGVPPLLSTLIPSQEVSSQERATMGRYVPSDLLWDRSQPPRRNKRGWHPMLSNYVCHGHMHGLSAEEWKEAMGGEVKLRYDDVAPFGEAAFDVDALVASSDQPPKKKRKGASTPPQAALFPRKLSEVKDWARYGQMQRTEIRRLACVATRLLALDAGVDAAVFREHQPREVRRQFSLAWQGAAEQLVLSQALPSDVQGIVAQYEPFEVDIPV